MNDTWFAARDRLTDAEKRRDYERCALISLEMSDMAEGIEVAQAWVTQAQVYATLSLTRQLQLGVASDVP